MTAAEARVLLRQMAPTIRFTLPDCSAAHLKVRFSAVSDYPLGAPGGYGPAVAGDAATIRRGVPEAASASVDAGGTWTLALDENAYGNVQAPGSGAIQFEGAPGSDRVFGNGFDG